MEFTISPYAAGAPEGVSRNNGPCMKLWPSLADKAFYLQTGSRPGSALFFYDSPAEKGARLHAAAPSRTGSAPSSGEERPSPLVVLIHGLGDEADSWRHVVPLLNAAGYRTIAPDLPGFGRSVAPGRIGFRGHVDAVLRLLEAVTLKPQGGNPASPPETPVFLAGNSMGAAVAEAAALRRPDLVRGLVLLDGTIPGGPPMPGPAALARLLFSRKWYRAYQSNPEAAWMSLYPYYADLDAMPETDREFLKERVMARVTSASQERAFFQTQRSLVWTFLAGASTFAEKIRNYRGKILLVWGENDGIMPLSSSERFRALRAGTGLEIIPGSGHLPQQEKPAETARLMADFFDSGC